MRPLAADRQAAAVTVSAIGTNLDQTLDVHRDVLAQVAFNVAFRLDHLADAVDFVFAEILHLLVAFDVRGAENTGRAWMADAVDVGQRDLRVLIARKVHACNTSHLFPLIALGVETPLAAPPRRGKPRLYPCRCLCFEFSQITRTTPRRWTILHLSQIFLTDALTFMVPQLTYNDTQCGPGSGRRVKAPPQRDRPVGCE